MGHLNALYDRLPIWAQHSAVSAFGVYWYWARFGPGFRSYVNLFTQRETFDADQWEDWQQQRLRLMLTAAASKVPYYRQAWSSREKAAAHEGALRELPLLEKDAIRAAPESFLRDDVRPLHRKVFHTSGSTGTPIASIWTLDDLRRSQALREVRSLRWAGVSYKLPRATFSGRMVEPDPHSDGPFYRFNAVEGQVYLSPFHLRSASASTYVHALRKHRVKWLTGYAVSYYLLATFILDQGLIVPPLRAVITTSEKVTPEMRRTMETAYGCRVYEEYSTVENSIFVSECEEGALHVSPDAGVIEILRPDGSACKPGEVGEVVVTGLLREYQLFIRYRLGDMAMWAAERCSCGRSMPVLKEVVGRIEDVVVGTDGRKMVRFHGVFVDQPHVREGQLIQEALDRVRVKVVPTAEFEHADVQDLVLRVQQRLGPDVHVTVETTEHIQRNAAGKFKSVISLLGKEDETSVQV